MTNSRAPRGRFSLSTRTTSGMTSPARRTITVSPMRTSLRLTSSSLCRVALVTVTPPTNTGLSRATGVNAPVRPTCTSIPTASVGISPALPLDAAYLGRCPLSRELARKGQPRRAQNEADPLLLAEVIDLVDDPVDLIRKLIAALADPLVVLEQAFHPAHDRSLPRHRKM